MQLSDQSIPVFTFRGISFPDFVAHREQTPTASVLLAELQPCCVLGRRQSLSAFQKQSRSPHPLYQDTRGGLETYHGPGQWTGYLIQPLHEQNGRSKSARGVAQAILQALQDVATQTNEDASVHLIAEGPRTGLWTKTGKLVSIGLELRKNKLICGFALNVFQTEDSFKNLNPCGLNESVDFLFASSDEATNEKQMERTRQLLITRLDRIKL